MTQEGAQVQDIRDTEVGSSGPSRGRSTVEFSYFDLANAKELAKAIKDLGGDGADWKQLAVKLTMAPDGGGFRARVMAGKTYGVLDYERQQVTLTNLGLRICDPQFERQASVEAFMAVPLNKLLFDRLNGQAMPPPAALERMIEQLGVAPKQKDKARQSFLRSAKQAGLFELSADRLSLPPSLNVQSKDFVENGNAPKANAGFGAGTGGGEGGNGGGVNLNLDALLIALLQKIPATGEAWPAERRLRWFKTFAMNVSQVYDGEGEPVELNVVLIANKQE